MIDLSELRRASVGVETEVVGITRRYARALADELAKCRRELAEQRQTNRIGAVLLDIAALPPVPRPSK